MKQRSFLWAGIVILLLAWLGPLPGAARDAFYAHMIMHMLVVALAAPLIAIGISESKYDPSLKFPFLAAPISAAVVELIVVWGWHAPFLHHFARHSASGLMMEQGMFFLVGVWLWLSSVKADQRGAGIIGLLLTSMHMTLLGALLGLAPRALYHHHGSSTSLSDQQLGGAIMLVVGGIVYLTGGVGLALKMLKFRSEEKLGES